MNGYADRNRGLRTKFHDIAGHAPGLIGGYSSFFATDFAFGASLSIFSLPDTFNVNTEVNITRKNGTRIVRIKLINTDIK